MPTDETVSATLRRMLRDGEELRWHQRPSGLYLRQTLLGVFLGGLVVVTLFYGLFVGLPVLLEGEALVQSLLGLNTATAVGVGWVTVQVLWNAAVGGAVYNAHGRVEYAATDQRAIVIGGFVGRDTSAIEWNDVVDIEIDYNLPARLFDTGVVTIRAGGSGVRFAVVRNPTDAVETIDAIRRGEHGGTSIATGQASESAEGDRSPVGPDTLPAHVRHMLQEGESVAWHGRPAFLPFAGPYLGGGGVAILAAIGVLVVAPAWWIVALGGLVGAGKAAGRALSYRNAEYVATDARVVQFSGGLGRDYSSVDWADVRDVEVTVGPVDGLFGTGTLRFSRAGGPSRQERRAAGDDHSVFAGVQFKHVRDPEGVAQQLDAARTP